MLHPLQGAAISARAGAEPPGCWRDFRVGSHAPSSWGGIQMDSKRSSKCVDVVDIFHHMFYFISFLTVLRTVWRRYLEIQAGRQPLESLWNQGAGQKDVPNHPKMQAVYCKHDRRGAGKVRWEIMRDNERWWERVLLQLSAGWGLISERISSAFPLRNAGFVELVKGLSKVKETPRTPRQEALTRCIWNAEFSNDLECMPHYV